MHIYYLSRTGNVKNFLQRLGEPHTPITGGLIVNEPFILVTYTTGFGVVPSAVETFLEANSSFLKGVASSGNRNFGQYFSLAADIISEKYNVPILSKFELTGTKEEIIAFREEKERIEKAYYTE